MSQVSAQFSVYPLGQEELGPGVTRALQVIEKSDLPHQVGPMSTLVWGEQEAVFAALKGAFAAAADVGAVVMTVTVSNGCPLPDRGA